MTIRQSKIVNTAGRNWPPRRLPHDQRLPRKPPPDPVNDKAKSQLNHPAGVVVIKTHVIRRHQPSAKACPLSSNPHRPNRPRRRG